MLKLSEAGISEDINQNELYTLRSLRTPSGAKILAKFLLGLLITFIIILFLPWQQNIRGSGTVTALNPVNRPQTIEAIIAGRIQKWHVQEGDFVKKGDTIVSITEVKEKYFDPQLLTRTREQIMAKEQSLISKNNKAHALEKQIEALRIALRLKVEQSNAKLEAEKTKYLNAQNQFARNKNLYDAGNIPLTKFQEFEYKFRIAEADYTNAQIELERVAAEYNDKISKSLSELSNTRAEAFEAEANLSKMRNEYANLEIRQQQYRILAPQSGFIVRALKAGIGETIKEGDAICTVMPESTDLAVEMYVRAMDVPLISKGRRVRVQFDGWPALQFSGWPSVSVGTFGGTVKVMDYMATSSGQFRLLVVPDTTDEAWPEQIRVGSGTKGWVMLDNVPIWYELWRQLNGFPPRLYDKPNTESDYPSKKKADGKKE